MEGKGLGNEIVLRNRKYIVFWSVPVRLWFWAGGGGCSGGKRQWFFQSFFCKNFGRCQLSRPGCRVLPSWEGGPLSIPRRVKALRSAASPGATDPDGAEPRAPRAKFYHSPRRVTWASKRNLILMHAVLRVLLSPQSLSLETHCPKRSPGDQDWAERNPFFQSHNHRKRCFLSQIFFLLFCTFFVLPEDMSIFWPGRARGSRPSPIFLGPCLQFLSRGTVRDPVRQTGWSSPNTYTMLFFVGIFYSF